MERDKNFKMNVETITSRKNKYILRLRRLAAEAAFRREEREYVCDGMKLLKEAVEKGAEIRSVLWKEAPESVEGLSCSRQYSAPAELFDYASPMKNCPGPVFTVAMEGGKEGRLGNAIALETLQDPGNVGTVLRTAKALGIGAVILTGDCADIYSPKAVRSSMGAVFCQRVMYASRRELGELAAREGLKLYAAVLSDRAEDIRRLDLKKAIVCVGSEGRGLSRELIELCAGEVIIPMKPGSESLNAAVAAAIIMWEMSR